MGGVTRFAVPRRTWSPAGGWWTNPKNGITNTYFAGAGIAAAALYVAHVGNRKTTRSFEPKKRSVLYSLEYYPGRTQTDGL